MKRQEFTLDDFRVLLGQVKKQSPLQKVLGMPGMQSMREVMGSDPERELRRLAGIIDSMTCEERRDPKSIDQGRRQRIAAGSGVEPTDVNELLTQFEAFVATRKQLQEIAIEDRTRIQKLLYPPFWEGN
jgi:signal recognition particle subunit SRP54